MMHESSFLGGEEAVRVVLLDDVEAGLVVVTGRREVDRELIGNGDRIGRSARGSP
jgi:hypothetical protein